ncbi:sensor histidine kinase [Schlesneria paludicola]|uniref:sensor histidine kinase n=1 Tax=Schlesneria paludicola TaxID=360056 RepID=UPI00029AB3EE|nr:ATP-binding protein [Schlesneria paludicola]
MKSNTSKSMLAQTLAPVILVATLWITMSSVTNYYVYWLERSHQRSFTESVVSIRATESILLRVWQLVAELYDETVPMKGAASRWTEILDEIIRERQRLDQAVFSKMEQQILTTFETSLNAFTDGMPRLFDRLAAHDPSTSLSTEIASEKRQIVALARLITDSAGELLKFNRELAERDALRRQRVTRVVLSFRVAMLIIGPVLGVFLGWRLALRMHRSMARIAVTLHDAGGINSDVGTIAIESSGDFADVQQQAEHVAERMRNVSRDLQAARREVLQSERLAAVGELAAGVAHEIRNPLTSVKLLLQHAIRQASGPSLDENKLRLILEEIGRMEATIQGLLDFSRPPKLNRIPHDIRQTLRRALNLVDARMRQQKIEIVTRIDESPLTVDGDTEKLHQVLVNLLINAIEAMPDGGVVTIDAAVVENRHLRPAFDPSPNEPPNEQWVQIILQDTGEGIPDEVLARLFEPFATSKERGTGLGLAVSRRIIEEHRGTIHAINCLDGGAQFTIHLPFYELTADTGSA